VGGRYRLVKRLGRGGMAEVYRAYQESLERHVAIKFIHPHLAEDAQFQQRFRREARHLAALHHPNIVQVIDYDLAEGTAYMVMEFIDGVTLDQRLTELAAREERLPLAEAVRLVRDAALALSYAHARDIIHRDIKPGNIMLESAGRIVLTDFGLAKLASAARQTATGAFMGTPAYAAPEQALGQAGDKRVDIYALGVLLYQLATGRLPFQADTAIALVLMHLNQPPPLPRTLNPDLPEGLEQVILKAMAKQPEARFQSADEFAAHLNYFLAPAQAAPPLSAAPEPGVAFRPLPPHNLPPQPTSFIGRHQELAETCALLRQADVRLLTLTGPGGAGKTRLSLQVASTLLPEFPDGVFFAPLADIREPDLVVTAMARAAGDKESGGGTLLDQLKAHLRSRRLLLVLDNLEQVLSSAPIIADLLAAAPDLKVLVTSRAPLRVYGEHEFPVPPLGVPDLARLSAPGAESPAELLADLSRYTALTLFAERAQAARPGFALTRENVATVVEICARLDGLPLAIELAAPRIKLLPLPAILAGLDNRLKLLTGGARDLPARQRTLRGAIEWGYTLLDPTDQALLTRLAVFAGGFTLEAAEAVLGEAAARDEAPLLDGLTVLVDNSLIRRVEGPDDEPRFAMLETIREYSLERLAERGELAEYQARHAAHFLALAESAALHLQRREQMAWLKRLGDEQDNLRAALSGALARRDADTALRLGGALWRYWLLRGYLTEGLKWMESIRQLATDAAADVADDGSPRGATRPSVTSASSSDAAARAFYGLGLLRHERGDSAEAVARLNESAALFRQAGDAAGAAHAQDDLGAALLSQGKYAEAAELCEAGLSALRVLGDEWGAASALNHLGLAALSQGDAARATQLCQESLILFQRLGDRWGMALALNNLGLAALPQGDHERAGTLTQSSLMLFRELESH
jgi:non-specific serine/threonine protein kinase